LGFKSFFNSNLEAAKGNLSDGIFRMHLSICPQALIAKVCSDFVTPCAFRSTDHQEQITIQETALGDFLLVASKEEATQAAANDPTTISNALRVA
jgi:hypothetical protein